LPCSPQCRPNRDAIPGPFFLKRIELGSGLISGCGRAKRAQIDSDGLAALLGAKVQGMKHQMYDAGLDSGLREWTRPNDGPMR